MPGAGGLDLGGLDGVGHAVVLAWLPDDRIRVVLAAVVDGDSHPEGEGGLALGDVAVADAVSPVSGHPELGVEPVKGLLGVADGVPLEIGMAVAELIGEAGVVVAVAGVQVAAEAVGDAALPQVHGQVVVGSSGGGNRRAASASTAARPDRGDRSACPAAPRSDRAGLA